MSMMRDYYKDLIDPTDLYENWHEDMVAIAKEDLKEKKILIELFENEQDKKVKSWLAGILIDLGEECVIHYLLEVIETDEDFKERAWAAKNLVKLESPYAQGIIAGLLKKNQIDKSNLAWELFELQSKSSRKVIDYLIKIDTEFFEKIYVYRDKERRRKEFPTKWFCSKAEQMYEGIDCWALCLDLGYEMQQIALESEYEREAVFEILEKEKIPYKKYILAEALLKADFERALGYVFYVIDHMEYYSYCPTLLLMRLNDEKALDAIKKISFPGESLKIYINDFLEIQTPIAKKVIEYLENQKPEWKEIIQNYKKEM